MKSITLRGGGGARDYVRPPPNNKYLPPPLNTNFMTVLISDMHRKKSSYRPEHFMYVTQAEIRCALKRCECLRSLLINSKLIIFVFEQSMVSNSAYCSAGIA